MTDTTPAAESLAVHSGFLRAFARALVRGDAEIDDVVQDAFVVALGKEPRDPGATRSWLAGIVRNLTLRRRKQASVRARHLSRLPRAAGEPSPAEIAAREEARRRVVAALLAEDELYRRPLLLRYYEGLGPREIAARMGVPLETVRTRLRRGLARLRSSLDEGHGGNRRAWSAVLLPLLLPAPAAGAGLATKVAVAVVLVAGAGAAVRTLTVEPEPGPPPGEPATELVAASAVAPAPAPQEEDPPEPPLEVADAPEGRLRVLVVDDKRRPLPDSEVQLAETGTSVRTGSDGTAEVAWTEKARPILIARAPGRWWAFERIDRGARSAVVVFPSLRNVTGKVVDDRGEPVPGARVVVVSPDDLSGWSSDPKHAHAQVHYPRRLPADFVALTTSDTGGRFRIEVPAGTPQVLMALKGMHVTERFVVQPDVDEAVLTAARGAELTVYLRGPEGEVEEGAVYMQWEDDCECPLEIEGRNPIVLQPLFPGRWQVLAAWGGGHLSRDPIELRLARGERREIEIRLNPRPAPTVKSVRWKVRILDADGERMTFEEIRRWRGRGAEENRVKVRYEENGGFRSRADIGPDGTFEVEAPEGVAPILSMARTPLRDPFVARLERGGGDAEIRLPIRLVTAVHGVRGRVVGPEGNPVERARVSLVEPGADRILQCWSDPDGRFELDRVVPPPWEVIAYKDGFSAASQGLATVPGGEVVLRLAPPPPPEPKGRLEIRILLERGNLAEADVRVSRDHRSVDIDALGRGAVDLPPGKYTIEASVPLSDGLALDTGTAIVADGGTTTVSLCGGPLTSARIQVAGAPRGGFEIAVKGANDRWITGGATVQADRPFRILYPPAGAKLALFHRDKVLWIEAPRGDVAVHWRDARSE